MKSDPSGTPPSNLELACALVSPEGVDWSEIARSRQAEAEFIARVGPLLHAEFETVLRQSAEDNETLPGLEGTLRALRRVGEGFESLRAVPERFIDLGDRVLALVHRSGRTKTGVEFSEPGAALYVIEAHQLRKFVLYSDRSLALADAGLSPEEANERGVPAGEVPVELS